LLSKWLSEQHPFVERTQGAWWRVYTLYEEVETRSRELVSGSGKNKVKATQLTGLPHAVLFLQSMGAFFFIRLRQDTLQLAAERNGEATAP
jgi:hypothetical protein